jgi:hypothetical protein
VGVAGRNPAGIVDGALAMADFTKLPVYGGVGDWHFNRFRIAFEPPKSVDPVILASNLLARFPTFINSDYATAKWGDHKDDGLPTVHFHGYAKYVGIDIGKPHTDWVAIVSLDPNAVGFTVQTLKREFLDVEEDVEEVGAPVGGGITLLTGNPLLGLQTATDAVGINRMHFLAGRRAWRIDMGSAFGLSNDVMVLETVAIERFSDEAFNIADSLIGLEKRLPNVWLAFLNNFVNQMGLKPVDQAPKSRWKKDSRATHIELSFGNQVGLMGDPEFLDAYKLYTRLLPTE